VVLGYDLCPLKYVALNQPTNYDANEEETVLDSLVEEVFFFWFLLNYVLIPN
jgi:hypothetical protein